jgi:hypothetical protein
MKTGKRRVWKTFYLESGRDYHELESLWQSWGDSKHKMIFEGAGMIQTNVPLADLRDMFRSADARWVDYISDTARS